MKKAVEAFRTYIDIEKNYSIHTRAAYLRDIKDYLTFCLKEDLDFLKIEVIDIRSFFSYLNQRQKLEKKSQSRKLSSLRTFYKLLHRLEMIPENLILSVNFPKQKRNLPKNFSPIEMEDILEYKKNKANPFLEVRDKAILELLYSTGIRVFELVNASIPDLDNDLNTLKVLGKGSKSRYVFIGTTARSILHEYLELRQKNLCNNKYIFINQRGNQLTTRGVRYILNERRKTMGMEKKVTPHKFRHTFATDLLNAGADIRAVQEMLGHVSLSSTQIYLSVSKERLKEIYRNAHPHAKMK